MDLVSFGFLALMVIVGGVVAYIADSLGRTLGKKRLTLFRMRPRHTAALLTVVAGMLIPLITVAVVSVVSSDVRMWIAEGRQAIFQRDQAIKARDTAEKELETLGVERDRLSTDNLKLTRDNEARRKELNRIAIDVKEQKRRLAEFEVRVVEFRRRVAELSEHVRTAELRLKDTNQDLARSRAELVTATRDYGRLQVSFREIKDNADAEYARTIELSQQNHAMSQDLARLERDKQGLETEVAAVQADLASSMAQLEQSRQSLESVQRWLALLSRVVDNSRTNKVTFALGDELARLTIPRGVDEKQARTYLDMLINRASEAALARSAAKLRDSDLAATLFERIDDNNQPVDVEEQEERLVKAIIAEKDDLVLVATAYINAFQGEPVWLNIRPYRNPLIYRAGEMLAEARINGAESELSILEQITKFLQGQVKEKALNDQMIPVAGSDQPLGQVGADEILDLVRTIRGHDRPMRLVALAEADTRAADALRLDFRIR